MDSRDRLARDALKSQFMRRVYLERPDHDDSQGCNAGSLLHDIVDVADNSYPRQFHYSRETYVYIYVLKLRSDGSEVLCKVAAASLTGEKRLVQEARMYESPNTASLQGTVMPKYHGLFQGDVNSFFKVTCMILEHCGKPLSRPLIHEDFAFRDAVLNAYSQLHTAPAMLVKGDASEYKYEDIVRRGNGQPCLVDYGSSRPHRGDCDQPRFDFKSFTPIPGTDLSCGEILEVSKAAGALMDSIGPMHYHPKKTIADYWRSARSEMMARGYNETGGHEVIQKHLEEYKNYLKDMEALGKPGNDE
ncbi:uncharacterized protein C8Q71DRAFT_409040 [Rhodofomes roseus]|uniref:Protein kinase domain-containing protein n=1 Tax=Rhodofomes roseus TaxID=34475 RepID=A0ABQ8JYM6_9APHY|nr:uncharacterized protein C8Q71DRAFT_409040 [Rhodofomes roseus]KAH9829374.1 hypothetical protein C8Q71DRAFT_409040 [Rhodofomes roseus]